jgi:hypothetical protein
VQTEEKLNIMLWDVWLCTLIDGTNIMEEPATSIFRVETVGTKLCIITEQVGSSVITSNLHSEGNQLKLGLYNDYRGCFPQSLETNAEIVHQIRPQQLPST